MTLPTFLTVGAEKCGTTALHQQLSHHPDIFMTQRKEPSFFVSEDPDFMRQGGDESVLRNVRSREEYEGMFSSATREIARGESSPCYLYSEIAAKKIHELIPEAKIIAILRNPTERAYSQYIFNLQRGWEDPKLSFSQVLDLEEERVKGHSVWAFHYVRRGMYAAQIQRFLEVFGKDQVLPIIYDDFVAKPAEVLSRVHHFVGVEPMPLELANERHNVTVLPQSRRLDAFLKSAGPIKSFARGILPSSLRQKIYKTLKTLNSAKTPEMSPADRERLVRTFAPDIERLSEFVEVDVRIWR